MTASPHNFQPGRPQAIERAKRAAVARGDWHPDSIPPFDLDTWRSEDVLERRESIEALGDSNPPAMAEVIGYMLGSVAMPSGTERERQMSMKPGIERAIEKIVGILSETQAASGMSKADCEELKQAFRELVAATRGNS